MGMPLFSPTGGYPGTGINPVAVANPVAPHYAADPVNMAPVGPPAAPVEPGPAPETPPTFSQSLDAKNAADAEDEIDNGYYQGIMPMGRPMAPVEGAYEDYSPLVGADPALYKDTFVDKPKEIAAAIKAGGEAEAGMASAAGDFYKTQGLSQQQELAVIQQHRAQRQAEIEAKQQQLEQATQSYSNDLADRGQFWRNPGNIIAAFGAALIALGSDDHAIGVKLISQAVNQDYAQRKGLADMHLGEMRSNLSAYRQLAGDRDLGDRLGFAESHRIAAMELQRISSQFQGPIAKAKAAQISSALLKESQIQMMQVHQMAVHHNAQRQDPGILAAHQSQGAAMETGPRPYAAGKTSAVASGTGATPGALGSGGVSKANISKAVQAAGGAPVEGHSDEELKKQFPMAEERAPGTSALMTKFRRQIAREAIIAAKGNPANFATEYQNILNSDKKRTDEIIEKGKAELAPVKGWKNFAEQVNFIESEAKALGEDPNKFLGAIRDFTPDGWAHKVQQMRQKYRGNPDSPEAKRQAILLDKSEHFHQALAEKTLGYYHEKLGGAMSPQELALGAQVIGTAANWQEIKGFANQKSMDAASNFATTYAAGNPRVAHRIQVRLGQSSNTQLNTKGATGKGK